MKRVNLTITGYEIDLLEVDLRKSLTAFYGNQETQLDSLCDHLYRTKKPYTVLKNVDESTANKYFNQLEHLGLSCSTDSGKNASSPDKTESDADKNVRTKPLKLFSEETNKRTLNNLLAVAVLVLAVGSSGYMGYKADLPGKKESDTRAVTTEIFRANTPLKIARAEEAVPVGIFEEWHERQRGTTRLNHHSSKLIKIGMSASVPGVIARVNDPLSRVMCEHFLIQQLGQTPETADSVQTSVNLIAELQKNVDKVVATLSLAKTYESLSDRQNAENAYLQAVSLASSIESANEQVIAQVSIAGFLAEKGNIILAKKIYEKAKVVAEPLSDNSENGSSAVRFIVQSEIENGLITEALDTVERITDLDDYMETQMQIADYLEK